MTASFSTDRSPLSVSARPAPWTGVARDPAAAADLPGVQAQRRMRRRLVVTVNAEHPAFFVQAVVVMLLRLARRQVP